MQKKYGVLILYIVNSTHIGNTTINSQNIIKLF
jgi:hypothetical protein